VRAHLADRRPDLIFVWNGAHIPHSAFHVILSSGVPTAFRVCEHWFSGLFTRDFFMRYLSDGHTGLRRGWSGIARAVNRLPSLRLTPAIQQRVAISWVSESLRQTVPVPAGLDPVLERTIHATTQVGAELSGLERRPAVTPLVAYVGRLSAEKGPDVAVDALSLLANRGVDVELVLAGDGPRQEVHRLKRAIQETGVPSRFTVPGWLDLHELGELLARAWVLAIPSVWEEPLGIVVVEGALARVPLVASRVGGIPELVGDDDALLVPPGDPVALADAIENVINRPVEATERAARAFTRSRSASWESYADATEAFVDDAYAALTAGATPVVTGRAP
jgi:glycosyltransferase involved in cell wall biosynthesis